MRLIIDLETQLAAGRKFDIAPFPKRCLLEGLDELGCTLSQMQHIEAFERNHAT